MASSKIRSMTRAIKYASIGLKAAAWQQIDRNRGQKYLFQTLSSMPGLSHKVVQIFAAKVGISAQEVRAGLTQLPLTIIRDLIAEGCPALHDQLDWIDDRAEVASIGQVHKGLLKDGREVAIKVQYPKINQTIATDLNTLLSCARLGAPKSIRLDIESYSRYFLQCANQETDYLIEAQMQHKIHQLKGPYSPHIITPLVLDELSSPTILTQIYEPSQSIQDARMLWNKNERHEIGRFLIQFLLHSVYCSGYIHSDPHPGNFGFRRGSHRQVEAVLYDYGSILSLNSQQRAALIAMTLGVNQYKDLNPFDFFVYLGFDGSKLAYIADRLPAVLSRMMEPVLALSAFDPQKWQGKKTIENILGEDKWWFRSAGPPWFLMLLRTITGTFHILELLDSRVPIGQLLEEIPLKEILENSGLSVPKVSASYDLEEYSLISLARHLKISVHDRQSHRDIVNLSLPARAVDDLETLIPEETLAKLTAANIDFFAVKAKIQSSGYRPQEIFEEKTSERRYRVWLE